MLKHDSAVLDRNKRIIGEANVTKNVECSQFLRFSRRDYAIDVINVSS